MEDAARTHIAGIRPEQWGSVQYRLASGVRLRVSGGGTPLRVGEPVRLVHAAEGGLFMERADGRRVGVHRL